MTNEQNEYREILTAADNAYMVAEALELVAYDIRLGRTPKEALERAIKAKRDMALRGYRRTLETIEGFEDKSKYDTAKWCASMRLKDLESNDLTN